MRAGPSDLRREPHDDDDRSRYQFEWGDRDRQEVALTVTSVALIVVNVAAWSAARRWAVGTDGSLSPFDWDTVHSPLPVVSVLAVHAACSLGVSAVLAAPWRSARAVSAERSAV